MSTTTHAPPAIPLTSPQIVGRIGIILGGTDAAHLPTPVEVCYRDDTVGLRLQLATSEDFDAWVAWLGDSTYGHYSGAHEDLAMRWVYGEAFDVPVHLTWTQRNA